MNESIITVRYAKAFFSLAKEKNMLPDLRQDIELVAKICNESTDFILFLESPVVKTSKKINLLTEIFAKSVNKLTLDFLTLITKNKREFYIPGICRNFIGLSRKDQGIKTAVITTATIIPDETLKAVKTILEKELDAKVELTETVKPEIIGGLLLRVDDKQLDASVSTQLKKIKTAFLDAEL